MLAWITLFNQIFERYKNIINFQTVNITLLKIVVGIAMLMWCVRTL